jgi:hypothetical protein
VKLPASLPWVPCCAKCGQKSLARAVAGALDRPMPWFDPGPPWMNLDLGSARSEAGAASSCATDPPAPAGYRVWTGAVPTELTQWAIDLLRHVNQYAYGTTWTMAYGGASVLARKDHHTWTWRGGVLVTGICIPGITLYTQAPAATGASASDAYDVGMFSESPGAPALSPWEVLGLGVVAGVLADELLRFLGRKRAHA